SPRIGRGAGGEGGRRGTGRLLRRQPLDVPAAVVLACIAQAIVEAVRATLPELERFRRDAEAAPVRGERNFALAVLGFKLAQAVFEPRTIRDHLTLMRRGGAELAAACSAVEVGFRFFGRGALHGAGDADLARQQVPVEEERRTRVLGQLVTLLALVVRVEDEAALIEALEQDGPRRGDTVARRGRQCHRVDLAATLRQRLAHPLGKLLEWICRSVL